MGVFRIRLLQIGDVHFPDEGVHRRDVDLKDAGFPLDIAYRTAGRPLQTVVRRLQSQMQKGRYDAITLMGDLTTRGDKVAYGACIDYISGALWAKSAIDFNRDNIIIAPGNHDVNRIDAKSPKLGKKFEYMSEKLSSVGLRCILPDCPYIININKESIDLKIVGINTSVGCGSIRGLPERVRTAADRVYDSSDIFDEFYEELDAPVVTETTVAALSDLIEPQVYPVIVVGHHNILPQYQPRIAPYTELMNSGLLRRCLLNGSQPNFYLHGHIHDDPVEVISSPGSGGGSLISVSAPLLSDGYNEIELEFTSSGVSLGATISKFRYRSGVVEQVAAHEISMKRLSSHGPGEIERRLLTALNTKRIMYWSEAAECTGVDDDRLEEIILSLMWSQMLVVNRDEADRTNWKVRGTG